MWTFILRSVIIAICLTSCVLMTVGFVRYRTLWNQKTRDYWYGRMAWSVFGVAGSLEGIIRATPLRYSTAFLIAAALVTLKGNLQKGNWGYEK